MYRRNAVLVLSLAASLLLFSRPLQAAEEGNNGMRMQIGKSETFVYLKAEKFVWKESDEGGRSLGKSHIREQVEKLNGIRLHPLTAPRVNALPPSSVDPVQRRPSWSDIIG
jgi:hypothetical protein